MARMPDPELAERRRRQILEAALACFMRRGFHQAGMSEICTEAGLSAGALYRYFSSKNDIIAAIAEEHRQLGAERFAAAPDGPVVDVLLDFFGQTFEQVMCFGSLIGDVIAEASRDRALGVRFKGCDEVMHGLVAERWARAAAAGEIVLATDAATAARIIGVFMDGLVLRFAVSGPEASREAALSESEFFLRAFLGAPKSSQAQHDDVRTPQSVPQEGSLQ